MNQKPLNLEDIAKKANVSRSTVSRVINGNRYVSDITREKVLAVIEEVGFAPNPAARMLVTQRTRIIGVVIPHNLNIVFDDPAYYPTLLQGVAEVTSDRDYAMLLWMAQSHEDEARFHKRILQNRLMDGLIIASARADDPLVEHLLEMNILFTMVERPIAHKEKINYVSIDNVCAARDVVNHLLGLGRRRIAIITGALNNADGIDRLNGYKIALEQFGLPVDQQLIAEGHFTFHSGYLGMKKLLNQGIDAVFAASDRMAMGAMQALREAEIEIPEEVSLVGFDDLAHAVQSTPKLTTVHQPITQRGAKATELLLDLIEGHAPDSPRQILLPTQLMIRESCGAHRFE